MTGQHPDTEQVIRDWLADSAPDHAPASLRAALENATSRPAGGVRSGPRVGRRTLLFAARIAAAAAILAIAVSGLYLYGRNRGTTPIAPPSGLESAVPSGSAASSPSGETSPVPSTFPGPATSPATAGWRQVDGVFPKTAANPDSVIPNPVFARWDGGFLAFVQDLSGVPGRRANGRELAAPASAGPSLPITSAPVRVLLSSDGIEWTPQPDLPTRNATVSATVEFDGLIVAVGSAGVAPDEVAMAWVTSDLRTWQAVTLPAPAGTGAYGIAARSSGFLAWGDAPGGTQFWIAADGYAWQSVAASGLPANASVDELYSAPGGYAIRGFLSDRAAVWKSSDGAHWTQAWTGPGPSGMEFYGLGPIVTVPGSYVSFGMAGMAPGGATAEPYDVIVWTSNDMTHWTRSARIPAPGWTEGFAAVTGGFVAAGAQVPAGDAGGGRWGSSLEVWTSADGLTWEPVAVFEATGSIEVLSVVGDGSHAVVTYVDANGNLHLVVGDGLGI